MGLDDVPHDGETETGGAHVPSVGDLSEALEDAVLLLGAIPGPVSRTATTTLASVGRALSSIRPSAGV